MTRAEKPAEAVARVSAASPTSMRRPGTRAPTPIPPRFDPFVSHAFLHALEEAGTRRRAPDRLAAASHHARGRQAECSPAACPATSNCTARASTSSITPGPTPTQRAGGRYYPKLQAAVPFSPVPGRRLLVTPGPGIEDRRQSCSVRRRRPSRQRIGVSSLHVTFLTEEEWPRARARSASCCAPTSSSTGTTRATPRSRISSASSPRASARPCARSARRR